MSFETCYSSLCAILTRVHVRYPGSIKISWWLARCEKRRHGYHQVVLIFFCDHVVLLDWSGLRIFTLYTKMYHIEVPCCKGRSSLLLFLPHDNRSTWHTWKVQYSKYSSISMWRVISLFVARPFAEYQRYTYTNTPASCGHVPVTMSPF